MIAKINNYIDNIDDKYINNFMDTCYFICILLIITGHC